IADMVLSDSRRRNFENRRGRRRFISRPGLFMFLTRHTALDRFKVAFLARSVLPRAPLPRPRRLARPRTPPFHGDNTGSNPVGDANKTSNLQNSGRKNVGLKRFDKDFPLWK